MDTERISADKNKHAEQSQNSAEETRAIPVNPTSQDETRAMHVAPVAPDPSAQTRAMPPASPPPPPVKSKGKSKGYLYILGGIAIFLILLFVGAFIGYQSGVAARLKEQSGQVATIAATQFQLALADMSAGNFPVARKRLEYVIQLDPAFPGAREKLTEVMLYAAQTQAPTAELPTLAPTVTPTPDNRAVEEIFNHAQQMLRGQDWNTTITTLDSLRTKDITYRTVDVDGMYYIAYRYRGIQKIFGGSLEPGIYDLALAERFGPLDKEANGARNMARQYQIAITFWEINWAEAVNYFSQLAAGMPNLTDGSGWTVAERYRFALVERAKELTLEEKYCEARDMFAAALAYGGETSFAPTATAVQEICSPSTATPVPTSLVPPTVTPGTPVGPTLTLSDPPPAIPTDTPVPPSPTPMVTDTQAAP